MCIINEWDYNVLYGYDNFIAGIKIWEWLDKVAQFEIRSSFLHVINSLLIYNLCTAWRQPHLLLQLLTMLTMTSKDQQAWATSTLR